MLELIHYSCFNCCVYIYIYYVFIMCYVAAHLGLDTLEKVFFILSLCSLN